MSIMVDFFVSASAVTLCIYFYVPSHSTIRAVCLQTPANPDEADYAVTCGHQSDEPSNANYCSDC